MEAIAVFAAGVGIVWLVFWRLNRKTGWFTIGEVIFWDVIILILIQLVWLRWF